MNLVFASNNKNKIREVITMMPPGFSVLSLKDLGCTTDIPEPFPSLEENALAKARFVRTHYGYPAFADDSGLEVDALDGLPGVKSARFAGLHKSNADNMQKLLQMMEGVNNREARFRAVIALIINDNEYLFEGVINGHIIHEQRGRHGFGYDPVFVPEGHLKTFAEMPDSLKNTMSHRARALEKMIHFLAAGA
jgi:XTP/dITP diphosphohydrolase